MGRAPCCDKANVKRGPWSPEEDTKLKAYIETNGTGGNWIALPHKAGLKRCGKSCRLRWLNYLRPNIKHGEFSDDEDRIICTLFATIGSRWSVIAAQLPGRTDNDIKNYWNTKLKKKLLGISPHQRKPHQQQHIFPSSIGSTAPVSSSSTQSSSYTIPEQFYAKLGGYMVPPDLLTTVSSTTNSTFIQGPAPQCHVKDSGSLLVFGGEHSCSSSDGSCNQISYGKEIDFEYGNRCHGGGGGEQLVFESYLYGRPEDKQKLLLSGGGSKVGNGDNGMWGDTPLEYSFDEIKGLLSPNQSTNPNYVRNSSNLYVEDPSSAIRDFSFRAEEKVMYYQS